MAKPAKPVQTYVTESMIRETVDKFNRLIKTLGINNTSGIAWVDGAPKRRKPASDRYKFEADFAYALNELQQGPFCLRSRLHDELSRVVISLIEYLKTSKLEAA